MSVADIELERADIGRVTIQLDVAVEAADERLLRIRQRYCHISERDRAVRARLLVRHLHVRMHFDMTRGLVFLQRRHHPRQRSDIEAIGVDSRAEVAAIHFDVGDLRLEVCQLHIRLRHLDGRISPRPIGADFEYDRRGFVEEVSPRDAIAGQIAFHMKLDRRGRAVSIRPE